MKKLSLILIVVFLMGAILPGCGTENEGVDSFGPSEESDTNVSERRITEEMAYEGVYNYCRNAYDWSIAEENPDMMYLEMVEETEVEYQAIFHSYTGALVYFRVDKLSGTTRLTEYVPALKVEEEAGTIDLYEYLE